MNIFRVYAQTLKLPDGSTLTGPEGFDSLKLNNLGGVVSKAIPFIFAFAGMALLLMLIAGGISLMTGASDPKQLESGKQRITYALVGFFVVILAYWVVQLVARIFGLEEFTRIFG